MTDQLQLENVEYCNYLLNLITTDANVHVSTRDVESRIDVTQSTFNKNSFHQQDGLRLKEETSTILHTEHNFVRR